MNADSLKRHFRNPHNRRELTGAAGIGRAGNPGCGAEITIYMRFDEEIISEATFTASGSSTIIASGSVLAERLEGMEWKMAAAIPASAIYISLAENGGDEADWERLNSLKPNDVSDKPGSLTQACDFTIEAFHRALEDSLKRGTFPRAGYIEPDTVLVAMSGGVDSSTACLLEKEAGKQVIGITMRLWESPELAEHTERGGNPELDEASPSISCCSPESIRDARQVCHTLGIPHLTVDYTEAFERKVVSDFISEYLAGRTPNPCTICNGSFRFPALVELARLLGAGRVATGHYARVVEWEGGSMLGRGLDASKDQSYMLWGIEKALLPWLDFPLGKIEKLETRKLARRAGLRVYDRVDSQDVCFIPDDDYRRFIVARANQAGGSLPGEGEIVDTDGHIMGYHRGYLNFTVGQRRGLGISSPEPLYVVRTDPESNKVVVGTREKLAVSSLVLEGVNTFMEREELERERSLQVQVRYNSPAIPCRLVCHDSGDINGAEKAVRAPAEAGAAGGQWLVEMDEPAYGVAPGQSAVLYIDDMVAAGGKIV